MIKFADYQHILVTPSLETAVCQAVKVKIKKHRYLKIYFLSKNWNK